MNKNEHDSNDLQFKKKKEINNIIKVICLPFSLMAGIIISGKRHLSALAEPASKRAMRF